MQRNDSTVSIGLVVNTWRSSSILLCQYELQAKGAFSLLLTEAFLNPWTSLLKSMYLALHRPPRWLQQGSAVD